ncbi:peptide chain release factor N(5)-glutamine methyltransferase [Psychrobacter frigidicola]|uniref:peptide chain release factor N(5)-glutamine methyltransferase n=1 Tax=Psychrobacter frigidicola TaxID=45611 RepID=UPI00191AA064|nr:peptide chain release factor N(5)-glutamine methyltransferase [Psychrobacter frigidicola]
MTVPKVKATTVQQIKQQVANTANNAGIPPFWITDWLLYVLDKPSLFLLTDDSYQLTDTEFEQFNIGVTKMQQGIPLAYLTGRQEFWSLDFMVNEHTLIPRPDTEVLVEQVLLWIKAQDGIEINDNGTINQSHAVNNKRLLDLGTGSGCIAISLAHELSKASWQVVAVDFSAEALKIAQYNAELNKIDNIELVQSSWYSELSTDTTQLFDVIVSNPPYIDEADEHLIGLLAEPINALSAPNQGLADIEHIVEYAPQYLYNGGLLTIEHGYNQGSTVRQLFLNNGFAAIQTIQDFGGNERVTLGQIKAL